jgi:hypothetical protein
VREPDGLLDALLETVAVPGCVGETDGLLETLVLPDSVIVPSLVMLWLTVTLVVPLAAVLTVADELAVPDCVEDADVLLESVVDTLALPGCVAETDALPDSVIVPSLVILWLTVTLLLAVAPVLKLADELAVPDCVEDTDVLLDTLVLPGCVADTDVLLEAAAETLGLPDSVVDASLEMLSLTVTLLVLVAAVVPLPDELAVPDCVVLLEASLDTVTDVESDEVTETVG